MGNKAFIVINPKLNYKEKYFTLIHEAGHLFYMKKNKQFNWAKKSRNEKQANWFTVQFLRLNRIDVNEYKKFYNKEKQIVKNRKLSWFEIK